MEIIDEDHYKSIGMKKSKNGKEIFLEYIIEDKYPDQPNYCMKCGKRIKEKTYVVEGKFRDKCIHLECYDEEFDLSMKLIEKEGIPKMAPYQL
ncbi:hypothetical protein C9439_01485 [archaeon SCG-AAA382B04]|nr:hypothetical protein C9439_01485 [archaeon SCG-AAA382B04]